MPKQIFSKSKEETVIIVKASNEIKRFVYEWLCNEIGESRIPRNHLEFFASILLKAGLKGKAVLSNLKDHGFDTAIGKKIYKIKLDFGTWRDSPNRILVTDGNVTKTYDWRNYNSADVKLWSVATKLENFELITYYCGSFISYSINTPKTNARIYLHEQGKTSQENCSIIAPNAKVFEERILSSKCKATIEDILSLIFDVYGKEVVNMSKEISIGISEEVFKAISERKEEVLIEELKLSKGNIFSIFKNYGDESVSIDLLNDKFIFCNKYNKLVFHKKSKEIILLGDDLNFKEYATKQIDSVISEYAEVLKKFQ